MDIKRMKKSELIELNGQLNESREHCDAVIEALRAELAAARAEIEALRAQPAQAESPVATGSAQVTVPLHPKKLKKRGYNQLHLFANTLSKHWGIPHQENFLKRNSYQKAQARKDKLHRLETKYDFSVTENLHGKHILLIDDVFTTGNTINTIAWEILKNPSNKISVLVMAIDV